MQTETRAPNVPRDSKGYKIAEAFYDAFKKLDAKTMGGLYADDATFSDPGFPGLDARHVRGMWDMLCSNAKEFSLDYEVVDAGDEYATVRWTARYTFSRTGRRVENLITASLSLKGGKIASHRDAFDFHRWAAQALGPVGFLLGGFGFFQKKVQQEARANLDRHLAKTGR